MEIGGSYVKKERIVWDVEEERRKKRVRGIFRVGLLSQIPSFFPLQFVNKGAKTKERRKKSGLAGES